MALISERFDCCSDLSIHGLHQIGRLEGFTKRKALFWALVFVSAVGLLSYQICRLVTYRMTYPTTVGQKVTTGPIDFPTVTFCSLGMIKKSIASKIPVFKEMQKIMNQFGDPSQKRRKRQITSMVLPNKSIIVPTTATSSNALPVIYNQTVYAENVTGDYQLKETTDKCKHDLTVVQSTIGVAKPVEVLGYSLTTTKSLVVKADHGSRRTKRSVAAVTCNGLYFCYGTAIATTNVLDVTSQCACVLTCVGMGSLDYTYYTAIPSIGTAGCICYSSDCCTSPLRVAAFMIPGYTITMIGSSIASCSDIFSTSAFGSGDTTAPFYECISVNYTCSAGNFNAQLQSSAVYTCQSTGLWAPTFSPCLAFCPNHFVLTTGSISPGPYGAGSYTFSCNTGWVTTSKQAADVYTCSSGSWDKPFVPCVIITCVNIFVATIGSVGPPPYTVGSYVFACKSNFLTFDKMQSQVYTCSNGNWDRAFSPCYAVCPNVFDTTGTIDNPPYMGFPSVHTFTCIPGYLLPALATAQLYSCQTNGLWSPSPFVGCIQECQQIVRPQTVFQTIYNGPLIQNLVPSGFQAAFICAANYTLLGTRQTSKCSNGLWDITSSQYPQCFADCNKINPNTLFPRLQVSYKCSGRQIHGCLATFSCNESFHFYGDFPNTTCVNGTWDVALADFPICLEQQIAYYSASQLTNFGDNSTSTDIFAAGATLTDMIPYIMSNLSESMKVSMGFTRDDNLVSCTFNNRICDKSTEILAFNDNSMGNCYSFNHKYFNESLMIDRPGDQSGLYWILNTKSDEFLSIVATSGIKLMIHQRFSPIFPNAMGTTVSPGFNYNFAIRKETEFRLETPVSLCYESELRAKYYYLANSSYHTEGCQRSYYQSQIDTNCSCASPHLPSANLNAQLCPLENRTCVRDSLYAVNKLQQNLLTYCPSACSSIAEHSIITDTRNAQNSKLMDSIGFTKSYQRSNLIYVKVFYQTLDETEYSEELAYTDLNLFSVIGSSLGLLVGMSAISLVELLVVIIQIFKYPGKY